MQQELRRRRRRPGPSARGARARPRSTSTIDLRARRFRAEAPEFVQKVTAEMIAGQGDDLPVSALPGRRHLSRPAPPSGRSATSPRDPGLGPGRLHPVRQVRAGLPARRHPRQGLRRQRTLAGAPDGFKSRAGPLARVPGPAVHAPGRRRGLHRLRACASRSARPRTRATSASRRSTWRRSRRCASPSGPTGTSSSTCPDIDRDAAQLRQRQGRAAARSRCSSSPAPAPAAARRRTSS